MPIGQKIATVTTAAAGAAAATVGSIEASNNTPASFAVDEVLSEAEDTVEEEPESTYVPIHNPQPLTLQQANPHYEEIDS